MMVKPPAWLEALISESFFAPCGLHQSGRKNECNVFCLHCCLPICPHCLPSHRSHPPLLQIRRYVYHDVVRLADLENLIHCSYIQPYTINGAKVIFLNHRPQSRPCKAPSNVCLTCARILQHPFHFCSLSCKVDHMVFEGADLSTILLRLEESDFGFSQLEGLPMDASQLTDDEDDDDGDDEEHAQITPNAFSKKNASGFLPPIALSLGSRRKGAPQRAPLS
ncbi:hypothetical protein SDJN03_10947, partial [Cucurbita argyrosperma subsp. sororia]